VRAWHNRRVEIEEAPLAGPKIIVEKNRAGKWFWHQIAANGKKVATSGQSFASKESAEKAALAAKVGAAKAKIEKA
jgi:uncharacterized protein YegP (UPF0339 family)